MHTRRRLAADHGTASTPAEIVEVDAGLSGERVAEGRLAAANQFVARERDDRGRSFVGAKAEDVGRHDDLRIGAGAGLQIGSRSFFPLHQRHRFLGHGDLRHGNGNGGGQQKSTKSHKNPFHHIEAGPIGDVIS